MEARANQLAHYLGRPRDRAGRPCRDLRLQLGRVGRDRLGRVQVAGDLDQHQLPLRQGRAALSADQCQPAGARLPARVLAARDRAPPRTPPTAPRDRDRGRQRRRARARRRPLRGRVRRPVERAGLRSALGRRPLHPLHRRHDRHAQGRGVAARGRLLRAGRRHRPCYERARHRPRDNGRPRAPTAGMVHLPVAPLMHGATQWCVMGQSFVGSKIVLMAKFDPHEVWRLVGEERRQLRHDHRRRHGQAAHRVAGRRGLRPRPLVAPGRRLVGCALLGPGQGPVLRAVCPTWSSPTPSAPRRAATTA